MKLKPFIIVYCPYSLPLYIIYYVQNRRSTIFAEDLMRVQMTILNLNVRTTRDWFNLDFRIKRTGDVLYYHQTTKYETLNPPGHPITVNSV